MWKNIGDAPQPQQYAGELRYPAQYAAARVLETGILRVGGLPEDRGAGSVSERRLTDLNHALMEEIADRWGVSAERIPGTDEVAIELLQQGTIDIAVGITTDLASGGPGGFHYALFASWRSLDGANKLADTGFQ